MKRENSERQRGQGQISFYSSVCVCTKNNYTYVVGGWLTEPKEALGCSYN